MRWLSSTSPTGRDRTCRIQVRDFIARRARVPPVAATKAKREASKLGCKPSASVAGRGTVRAAVMFCRRTAPLCCLRASGHIATSEDAKGWPFSLRQRQVPRPGATPYSFFLLLLKHSDVVHCLTLGVRALRRDGHRLPVLRDDPREDLNNLVALLVSAFRCPCIDALE